MNINIEIKTPLNAFCDLIIQIFILLILKKANLKTERKCLGFLELSLVNN